MSEVLKLVGVVGSPYSRKMRALLRHRRIPHHWVGHGSPEQAKLPPPPLPLLPVLHFPTGDGGYEATSDSTFQIQKLEAEFAGRSAIPTDPVVALLDFLVEDYADEWATKMMFHYRWAHDWENANSILPRWRPAIPEKVAQGFGGSFGQRQIDRLALVGSNEVTAPIIEASYLRLLDILERHFQQYPFVMGRRPGSADFGLFGQLSQLVQVEPTSQALARARAPRVIPWCDNLEDLSGWEVDEGDWLSRDDLPDTFRELLSELGRTYAPFLLANAQALESGAEQVQCRLDGQPYSQAPFRYQGKCLQWLREGYASLTAGDRAAADRALAGTGCEALF